MLTRRELAAELLKTVATIAHAHVDVDVPEHDDLRLRLRSDGGAEPALLVAARFADKPGWRILKVESEGGQLFTLWLTVESDEGQPT
ncbi:hypothetical protein ACFZB9_16395 [Kitasatospora sp. NPDC008050]|uniref:hypothetical protein n=1 Tax=Kitasatospora sp. NPDC008050 TaxID=3364021 RepID=UPI0036E8453C